MSPQSIVCATCDATVPYGRLSCPACGELLASVAGAARPTRTRAATARATKSRTTGRAAPAVLLDVPPLTADAPAASAEPDTDQAEAAPAETRATFGATGTATLGWDPPGWDTHGADEDQLTDEVPEASAEGAQARPAPLAAPDREPSIFQPVPGAPTADAPFQTAAPAAADTHGANVVAAAAAARTPSPVAWPADQATRDAAPVAWPADQAMPGPSPEGVRPVAPVRSIPDAPGAYVPPILSAEPAGPPAPARAWAGHPATDEAVSGAATAQSSWAGELLDAARVTEFVGWLAVAGSAMAAVGFLLPWGVSVIGASGIGYFDRWGLAGPFHPLVLLSLLAVLGLSLVPNRVPVWLRVGVLGLGLGALLLGLAWPYLVGLSGTGPGAMVVTVGALILTPAGIVALATDRHAHEDRAV
jgi:hypothetical protein